jgi:ribosome-associated protein
MAEDLTIRPGVVVPASELTWRFSRSSGPGGQGVNTTDSRVELLLDVSTTSAFGPTLRARALQRLADRLVDGVLRITAQEERSQLRNRDLARQRMATTLAEAIKPPPRRRRATKPSKSSVERRLSSKKRRGDVKLNRRPPSAAD